MARFRNDTGNVLESQDFGLLPPGEFEVTGYDRDAHGVIPGCEWLDAPAPEPEADGEAASPEAPPASENAGTPPPGSPRAGKRGKAADEKESALCRS